MKNSKTAPIIIPKLEELSSIDNPYQRGTYAKISGIKFVFK